MVRMEEKRARLGAGKKRCSKAFTVIYMKDKGKFKAVIVGRRSKFQLRLNPFAPLASIKGMKHKRQERKVRGRYSVGTVNTRLLWHLSLCSLLCAQNWLPHPRL